MPGRGERVEAGDACAANAFGTVHRVQERPWLLTRVASDVHVDERLDRLREMHAFLATRQVAGIHTFFWYGLVENMATGRTERVLLETDITGGTATLAETSVLDLPLKTRLRLASSLAETLATVAGLPATLGRLDDRSIRLDPANGRAVVTGLESGAFGPPSRRLVLDFGAPSGHLAPELYDGDGIHAEYADARTDAWALAVALHRLMFGCHPYHFMSDLRPDTVARELAAHDWPGPGTTGEFDAMYRALPPPVLGLLHRVFRQGWAEPGVRPTAEEWNAVLGQWTKVPQFVALGVDRRVVTVGEPVTLSWTTRYASHVTTTAGRVLPPSGAEVLVPSATGPITLWATGFGEPVPAATPTVVVLRRAVVPRLRSADRPEPSVDRPEPSVDRPGAAVGRPEPAIGRPEPLPVPFGTRPAMLRPGAMQRPPAVRRPPAAPRFPCRPSDLQRDVRQTFSDE